MDFDGIVKYGLYVLYGYNGFIVHFGKGFKSIKWIHQHNHQNCNGVFKVQCAFAISFSFFKLLSCILIRTGLWNYTEAVVPLQTFSID